MENESVIKKEIAIEKKTTCIYFSRIEWVSLGNLSSSWSVSLLLIYTTLEELKKLFFSQQWKSL